MSYHVLGKIDTKSSKIWEKYGLLPISYFRNEVKQFSIMCYFLINAINT